jgi:hypothetical protein
MLVQDVVQGLAEYPRDVVGKKTGSYSVALEYQQNILDKCLEFFHLTLIQPWEDPVEVSCLPSLCPVTIEQGHHTQDHGTVVYLKKPAVPEG